MKLDRTSTTKKIVAAKGERIKDVGEKTRCMKFRSANAVKPLTSMRKVVQAGNVVVLDEKNPHIRNNRDGTDIMLDVNSGVYTTDMWVCLDETGPVFSWQEKWVTRVSQTSLQDQGRSAGVEAKSHAGHELNGLEEGEDAITDEEGEGVGGEGEAGTADWIVRTGPRNKPTGREREEHEATHVPFRDWCTHCMMGRGRSHHHLSKKRSEDLSRRPRRAMDYHFSSQIPSQTTADESVTCIAVKDRHQNIMSSVVLKKGIDEPWASERVTRFINSLGYKDISLKSDTEPAVVAFRNRVAENCNAEVTLEDAVKGDTPSNELIETAVMLLRGVIRTIKCHVGSCTQEELREDSPILPWLVEHAGSILSRCLKGRDRRTPFERFHGKKPTQDLVKFGEKVLARPISSEPLNRMYPRYKFGVWLGVYSERERSGG